MADNSKLDLINDVASAQDILSAIIEKATIQGAQNIDMFFSLRDGLIELHELLVSDEQSSKEFRQKWDSVMGWVSRVFEDHPLLELIYKIDKQITEQSS